MMWYNDVAMKAHNMHIPAPRNSCKNEYLRTLLHKLPLNAVLKTKEKDAPRIANSLSRTTKKESGTYFTVRYVGQDVGYEIQCQRYVAPRS